MSVARSNRGREFDAADFDIMRRVAPHVGRAVATHQKLSETLASRQAMADALDRVRQGVLGLDMTGRIVFANQIARSLLAAGDALRSQGGKLAAIRSEHDAALRRMIRSASRGDVPAVLTVQRPDGRSPLLLELVPMGSSAAVMDLRPPPTMLLLIDDPEIDGVPAAASLSELYGLTATEAAVAIHVARGKGLAAMAQTLGIAPSTARSHLKQVFDKTDTHRQAELAWTLARFSDSGA